MLVIEGLQHRYGNKTVLDIAALTVASGSQGLLLGPSGCGKTTLLHLLAGLIRPQTGRIVIENQDISLLGQSAMDRFRAQHIALVPQKLHLLGSLSVLDNLLAAQYLARRPQEPAKARELLAHLGLADHDHKRPSQLSHGQAQRVAIARAVINGPALILADEPTSNLDDSHALQVADLLQSQAKAVGAMLLIATHDQRLKDTLPTLLHLEAQA